MQGSDGEHWDERTMLVGFCYLCRFLVTQKHMITHVGLELLFLADSVEKKGLRCKIYGFEPEGLIICWCRRVWG
jgi:hypothetical protein